MTNKRATMTEGERRATMTEGEREQYRLDAATGAHDDGFDDDAGDAPEEAVPPKKAPRRAKKAAALVEDTPQPPAGKKATSDVLQVRVTRIELPDGFMPHTEDVRLFKGEAGWVSSHDLKYIQEYVESKWGGGVYRIEFYEGHGNERRAIGQATTISVPGDPLPLREPQEPPQRQAPLPPPAPAGGGFGPQGPWTPPFQSQGPFGPPFPPAGPFGRGGWVPPGARGTVADDRADELEKELERLRKEKEDRERDERMMRILEARLPKTPDRPAADPMQTFMQMLHEQAKIDAQRREAEERRREEERRDERARREAEEKRREEERREERERREAERKERLEREERERREKVEREEKERDREERRREREEERRREDEKERREFLKELMSAKSRDPVEDILRLTEARQQIIAAEKPEDKEETVAGQVIEGVSAAMSGLGDYLSAKAEEKKQAAPEARQDLGRVNAPPAPPAGVLPGPRVPQPAARPQPRPPAPMANESQFGTYAVIFAAAVEAYKAQKPPEHGAAEVIQRAQALHQQGNKFAGKAVEELAALGDAGPADIIAGLAMLKPMLTNAKLLAVLTDGEAIVKTPEGAAWVKSALAALKGGQS